MNRKPKSAFFGYLLFSLALTAALLYFQFPADALRTHLAASLETVVPGATISVTVLRPALPPGVTLERAAVYLPDDTTKAAAAADRLDIRPIWGILLRGTPGYRYEGSAYGGALRGETRGFSDDAPPRLETSVTFQDLQLARHPRLKALLGPSLRGRLQGRADFRGPPASWTEGLGSADLTVAEGRIPLPGAPAGLKILPVDHVHLQLGLRHGTLTLERLAFRGPALEGLLRGSIRLQDDFASSTLALTGELRPRPELFSGQVLGSALRLLVGRHLRQGRLFFVITGTVREPRLELT